MGKLSTSREFLNKYNMLDYFLRELGNGEEGKGYISIYKDTLEDLSEQMQFKSLNQLRNQLAHGVYLSNDPISISEDILLFLDNHLDYVNKNKEIIKNKMLVAIENRKIKDLERNNKENISQNLLTQDNKHSPKDEAPKVYKTNSDENVSNLNLKCDYDQIKSWALSVEYVSMSKIQRQFNVGFVTAGKIVSSLQTLFLKNVILKKDTKSYIKNTFK